MLPDVPTTTATSKPTTTTTQTVPPPQEETYSPISALIITLVSFLIVCLIFFLLYFHFYQVGKQFKIWIKGSPKKGVKASQNMTLPPLPPLPPPRVRKPKESGDQCIWSFEDCFHWNLFDWNLDLFWTGFFTEKLIRSLPCYLKCYNGDIDDLDSCIYENVEEEWCQWCNVYMTI